MFLRWRYKRFHVSYLLAWCALGVLVGLVAGQYLNPFGSGVLLGSLCIFAISALRSRRWYACGVVLLVGLILGMFRASYFAAEVAELSAFAGQTVTLRGSLSQDPVQQLESSVWRVQLQQIQVNGRRYVGEVYGTVLSDEPLTRADTLTIREKVREGFGSFQLSFSRAELVARSQQDDPFLKMRDTFAGWVRRVVPEPEASLGLGFVVGQKSALPDDLEEQLKVVGLTHIVVASGYNLTILVRFARRMLARRSRYLALVGSASLVAGFVAMSGMSPSMNRAAIVTVLSLLAWYYGRVFHPLQLILYVAAVSAFFYPLYIWSDLGWLLSFTAFGGVLVVAPIVTRWLYAKDKEPSALMRLVIETFAAQVMTLPIIIGVFGTVPVFALIANVVVAPVIPFAMLATFIAGIVGGLWSWFMVGGMPAAIVIAYVVAVVDWLAAVPWASMTLTVSSAYIVLWYVVLVVLLTVVWWRKKIDLRASSVLD